MIGKNHISGEPVSVAQAYDILEERKKAGELGYEQQISEEHSKKFKSMDSEKAAKMQKELSDIDEISKKEIIKIIDIMPANDVQLINTLLIEKKTFEEPTRKKILEIVAKYKGK
ncbi:MAG TPA: hypothetical protein VNF06_00765 [Candidatus Aquilonibacter sp.]|nr:hypothetical protein [Candidatus Aquilonibacter sp.]